MADATTLEEFCIGCVDTANTGDPFAAEVARRNYHRASSRSSSSSSRAGFGGNAVPNIPLDPPLNLTPEPRVGPVAPPEVAPPRNPMPSMPPLEFFADIFLNLVKALPIVSAFVPQSSPEGSGNLNPGSRVLNRPIAPPAPIEVPLFDFANPLEWISAPTINLPGARPRPEPGRKPRSSPQPGPQLDVPLDPGVFGDPFSTVGLPRILFPPMFDPFAPGELAPYVFPTPQPRARPGIKPNPRPSPRLSPRPGPSPGPIPTIPIDPGFPFDSPPNLNPDPFVDAAPDVRAPPFPDLTLDPLIEPVPEPDLEENPDDPCAKCKEKKKKKKKEKKRRRSVCKQWTTRQKDIGAARFAFKTVDCTTGETISRPGRKKLPKLPKDLGDLAKEIFNLP